MEIVQLYQVRKMWEDLQRQIRSLHVTVRVERQNADQTDAQRDSSNPGTSSASLNDSGRNFKKTLLENYQRESSESDQDGRSHDPNQPSTSKGITGHQRNRDEASSSVNRNNVEESTTNISLSNLLPSDEELRRMQCLKLNEILDGLYERLTRCQNCNSRVADDARATNNDHTYANLTTESDMQLPSMSSVVSNIGANSNLPAVTAITTESEPLPSISSFVSTAGSSRSTQISDTNTDYSATGSATGNNSTNDDNINSISTSDPPTQCSTNQGGSSASGSSLESSTSGCNRLRGRQKLYLRYTYIHILL